MLQYRTHSLSLFLNITNKDESQMDIVIKNGDYDIDTFKSKIRGTKKNLTDTQ
jgi:hypothetical protein